MEKNSPKCLYFGKTRLQTHQEQESAFSNGKESTEVTFKGVSGFALCANCTLFLKFCLKVSRFALLPFFVHLQCETCAGTQKYYVRGSDHWKLLSLTSQQSQAGNHKQETLSPASLKDTFLFAHFVAELFYSKQDFSLCQFQSLHSRFTLSSNNNTFELFLRDSSDEQSVKRSELRCSDVDRCSHAGTSLHSLVVVSPLTRFPTLLIADSLTQYLAKLSILLQASLATFMLQNCTEEAG